MDKRVSIFILFSLFLFASQPVHAQAGGLEMSSILLYSIIAVVVLLILGLVVFVADNLLQIEAKQMGISDTKGVNFSVFPKVSELSKPQVKTVVAGAQTTALRKGYDILLEGKATKEIDQRIRARTFAVQPPNFVGISPIPKVTVEVGDEVRAGDVLFFDKKIPEVKYTAPVSGEVIAVNRGAKRSIAEVVILADNTQQYRSFADFDWRHARREDLVAYLLETGVWAHIRQRPYDVVPKPNDVPRDVFVTTFDTAPLAPDNSFVIAGHETAFQTGLDVLNKLTPGKVHLGLDGRKNSIVADVFANAKNVEKHIFSGPHPAGNVGVQIHHTAPINAGDKVWTLGVQDVLTLGRVFTENRYNTERVIVLAGAELNEPTYVRTYLGANIGELLKGKITGDNVRIISGDVLSGKRKTEKQYLDFLDDQITVVKEGDYYEMFGWLLPLKPRPSISRTFPNFLFKNAKFTADTNTHGEKRAFVVTGQYEKVLPMDIYVQHLMKAILVHDFERMEGLGIYELTEEDVALCEFVCTSKQPLQKILRQGLDLMREQG